MVNDGLYMGVNIYNIWVHIPSAWLRQAELRLRARQHREALLCSLALRLAVGSEEDLPELPETPPSTDQETHGHHETSADSLLRRKSKKMKKTPGNH